MLECGVFKLRDFGLERVSEKEFSPELKQNVGARCHGFRAQGPGGAFVDVDYAALTSGERLVRGTGARGPKQFRHLADGRRTLTLRRHDGDLWYAPLRQIWFEPDDERAWPQWRDPTIEDLDAGAQVDVRAALREAGAIDIGTKEDLLQMTDNKRHLNVVLFRQDNMLVPVATFVLTRVLPAYYKFGPSGPVQPRLL